METPQIKPIKAGRNKDFEKICEAEIIGIAYGY